jgi:hypothetical protein
MDRLYNLSYPQSGALLPLIKFAFQNRLNQGSALFWMEGQDDQGTQKALRVRPRSSSTVTCPSAPGLPSGPSLIPPEQHQTRMRRAFRGPPIRRFIRPPDS